MRVNRACRGQRGLESAVALFLCLLFAGSAVGDVRLTLFVGGSSAEYQPLQDAVAVLVEETGGEVFFEGTDSRFMVVRAEEGALGVLRSLPMAIHVDHTCIGWEPPCSELPINVDLEVTPEDRAALLELVADAEGTIHGETVLGNGDSYFSLGVPVEALEPIDDIEGVHGWAMQIIPDLGGTRLRLGEGLQFLVTAEWETDTSTGSARAIFVTRDGGGFYFFRPENLELTVKVLDGCSVNGYYWVFVSGLTNVGVSVRVAYAHGAKVYENPVGETFETVADTAALPCL